MFDDIVHELQKNSVLVEYNGRIAITVTENVDVSNNLFYVVQVASQELLDDNASVNTLTWLDSETRICYSFEHAAETVNRLKSFWL